MKIIAKMLGQILKCPYLCNGNKKQTLSDSTSIGRKEVKGKKTVGML